LLISLYIYYYRSVCVSERFSMSAVMSVDQCIGMKEPGPNTIRCAYVVRIKSFSTTVRTQLQWRLEYVELHLRHCCSVRIVRTLRLGKSSGTLQNFIMGLIIWWNRTTMIYLWDKRAKRHVPYICLSVVYARGVHPMGGGSVILHRNLMGGRGRGKNPDQPIYSQNLVSWLSGKSLKLLPPDITFKAKMHQIRLLVSLSLCSFVS